MGTTPAHAGKTHQVLSQSQARSDHPRACGEDRGRASAYEPPLGPPPRMRGRLVDGVSERFGFGTTPAHAGKTTPWCSAGHGGGDHPRACGEDIGGVIVAATGWGPPPRMRGRPERERVRRLLIRTTPAHAGKTSPSTKSHTSPADHPRACGEDDPLTALRSGGRGPPPRMRGRLWRGLGLLRL